MKQAAHVGVGNAERHRAWLQPPSALYVLCPSIVLTFFGSVALAASVFPSEYDIRYRWISSLASARDNPEGYHYLGAGLICMSLLSAAVARYLFLHCPGRDVVRRVAAIIYASGILGMLGLGIEAAFFPNAGPTRLIHQILTLFAFAGYALGLSCFVFLTALAGYGTRQAQRYAWAAGLLLAIPFLASTLGNLVWHLTQGDPVFFGSDHPKRLPWVVLSQPFWEWLMLIDQVLVLYLTVWYLERGRSQAPVGHSSAREDRD